MWVGWLDEALCQEVSWTGGKAANLSRLAARQRIPPGFCLTTLAYAEWAAVSATGAIPAAFTDLLAGAYAELARRTGQSAPAVAVRSSAVAEDGAAASFAGQYETFLNIVGVEALQAAVLRCWASAQMARVQAYQQRQGGGAPTTTSLAVLVQAIVPADASFVAFSANPVTGAADEVVINASWGLGESVVSGTVTPDTFVVGKADRAIRSQSIADKAWMTIPAPATVGAEASAGVAVVAVPRFLRKQPALTPTQVAEVTDLALTLATEMGWPVDLEGAFYDDKLYLLQCRPITK